MGNAEKMIASYELYDLAPIVRFRYQGTTTKAIAEYRGLIGTGTARLLSGDRYNREVGEGIAEGRALINLGIKYQNQWILRSRTEEEVRAQRGNKSNNSISVNVNVNRQTLDKLFKDVNNFANRPFEKKKRQPSKSNAEANIQYGEPSRRAR